MIRFSNGQEIEYFIASGALAFDGKGWLWERPLVWYGLIKPELFGVTLKSLTLKPRKGNLRWWKPWDCVRPIPGGAVNKVGLTNPGFTAWLAKTALRIDYQKYKIIVSLFGDTEELVTMARNIEHLPLAAVEINFSCPNTGHGLEASAKAVEAGKAVHEVSRHPLIMKVSCDQDYLSIAAGLKGVVEAISINSVPWKTVFGEKRSPLHRLEKRVAGGGGGVSGKPAQGHNWRVVSDLAKQGFIPVIAPSIMELDDLERVWKLGARAYSFGTIHLPTKGKPWTLFTNSCKPTRIVLQDMAESKLAELLVRSVNRAQGRF